MKLVRTEQLNSWNFTTTTVQRFCLFFPHHHWRGSVCNKHYEGHTCRWDLGKEHILSALPRNWQIRPRPDQACRASLQALQIQEPPVACPFPPVYGKSGKPLLLPTCQRLPLSCTQWHATMQGLRWWSKSMRLPSFLSQLQSHKQKGRWRSLSQLRESSRPHTGSSPLQKMRRP